MALIVPLMACAATAAQDPATLSANAAEKLGWRLGVQAYCFNQTTFLDMVDRLEAIGIRYLEAYPGQKLGGEFPDTLFNEAMPENARDAVKRRLEDAGITLVNIGVIPLPNDEPQCRRVFDFAKDMRVETIVSEPPADAFPLIDRLCAEYDIDLAIHNHPEPSQYWHPNRVLAVLEDRTDRIGFCIDTSHWLRSGLDVLEWLPRLEGKIKCFHLGDVNAEQLKAFEAEKAERKAAGHPPTMVEHIVRVRNAVFGEGASDVMAWLTELKRQNLRTVFSIEAFYERPPDEAQRLIAECAGFFHDAAEKLANP